MTELTDEEYTIFLGMLSTEELTLEVEHQRRECQYAQSAASVAEEFVTRWGQARADFDATDKSLHDFVQYEAQKVMARRDFEDGMCLTEDLFGDAFT